MDSNIWECYLKNKTQKAELLLENFKGMQRNSEKLHETLKSLKNSS